MPIIFGVVVKDRTEDKRPSHEVRYFVHRDGKAHICATMHALTHTCKHTCTHLCPHTATHTVTHTHIQTHIQAQIHANMHTYKYTYKHTYAHIHAEIRKNRREGLVFLVLRRVVQLVSNSSLMNEQV